MIAGLTREDLAARWSRMSRRQREEAARLVAVLDADARAHPLAYATLWHRAPPRTSQRATVRAVLAPGIRHAFVLGGNRCLGAEVLVDDPYRGPTPIGSFGSGHVWAWDGTAYVIAPAVSWAPKGPDPLLRVGLADGRSFTATAGHRVLTRRGWLPVGAVRVGDSLRGFALDPQATTSGTAPPVRGAGAHRSTRTTPGCPVRCSPGCRRCDAPPPPPQGVGLGLPPSPDDARARSPRCSPTGGLDGGRGCTRSCPRCGPPSIAGGQPHRAGLDDAHESRQLDTAETHADRTSRSRPRPSDGSGPHPLSTDGCHSSATRAPRDHSASFTPVASIAYVRTDYHHDLYVPGLHNYVAAGAVHHNSGKSELGAQLDVAHALGGDHPDVVRWGARNGIDVSTIPRCPGRVCSSALTNSDSRRYLRPKVARYCPAGTVWRNREGQGEAEATLPGGGVIVFKSCDQGREGYQGDSFRWMRFDEEPPLPVIEESEMRVADQRGRIAHTMTPLSGWTDLLDRMLRELRADVAVSWIHGTDNPFVPADELAAILSRYGVHMQAARGRGEITALEGRVWDGWRRDLHVREFVPAPEWVRYMAIDWGTSVPTHMVHAAYDAAADTLYVVDEWAREGTTITQRVDAIRALERDHGTCAMRWADPEDASTSRTIITEHGIALKAAKKDVILGINAVATRLAADAIGAAHLVVHPRCRTLIRQVEGYTWSDHKRDAPTKADDHGCDALRYLVVGVGRAHRVGVAEV